MHNKLVLISLAFFNLGSTVSSIDPCDAILRKKGTLAEVLKPQHRMSDLLRRIDSGEKLHITIGVADQTEISIRTFAQNGNLVPVLTKTHKNQFLARRSLQILNRIKELKERGLIHGFDFFEFLTLDGATNIFQFEEGRELISVPGDLSDLSDPEMRAIRRSYVMKLNLTRRALERTGATVQPYNVDGDLPHLVATLNGNPFLYISPYSIWVTTDGRFLIFDPL